MKIETIFSIVSAVGVIGGILAWFLSRLLDDRLDAKESKMEIGYMKKEMKEQKELFNEKINDLKLIMKKYEDWYDNGNK